MKKLRLFSVLILFTSLATGWADSQEDKMIKDLSHRDPERRRAAAEYLADAKSEAAVPALTQALKDKDEDVRVTSAYALWNIGDASAPARAELRAALADESGLVRIYSAGALEMLGENPKNLIPAIKEAMADSRMWVRAYAIENLLGWKVSIPSLLPEIRSVFSSTPAGTPKEKTSLGFLAGFLSTENQDPNSAAKELLAKALVKYPQPPEMLPIWKSALDDPSESVRGYAMDAVIDFKPVPPDVLKKLSDSARGFSDIDRMHALEALGSLEPVPPDIVAVLVAGMKDKQELVRSAAAHSLANVKPATKDVVDALILGLRDKRSDVREDSAEALEKIGPAGKDAIPVLQELAAKDKEWTVQSAAREALRAMGVKQD